MPITGTINFWPTECWNTFSWYSLWAWFCVWRFTRLSWYLLAWTWSSTKMLMQSLISWYTSKLYRIVGRRPLGAVLLLRAPPRRNTFCLIENRSRKHWPFRSTGRLPFNYSPSSERFLGSKWYGREFIISCRRYINLTNGTASSQFGICTRKDRSFPSLQLWYRRWSIFSTCRRKRRFGVGR